VRGENVTGRIEGIEYREKRKSFVHTMDATNRENNIRTTDTNGVTLAYQVIGGGDEPLLMINGFASTMDTWNPPLLAMLAEHFRVIIFDNRGTGYSSASDEPFTIPLFANDAVALMDTLGISHAHILGLSMGASIAQELVLAHPDRVERLILVAGTPGGERAVPMEKGTWETLADKSGTAQDLAKRMFTVLFPRSWLASHDPWQYCPKIYETTSVENTTRQAAAFNGWPGAFDRLSEIRSPVLVLTGTNDVVIPPENAALIVQQIPGASLVRIPDAGHGLQYQYPEECGKIILEFLSQGT
jgi:pimeloyl-ACP methyl ester carboxylesterase